MLKRWQIVGAVFTIVLGTLLHFTYEWSGENAGVGLVSAVNESTWEHLKLLFMPMLLFGVWEYLAYGRMLRNFIPVKVLSILVGMVVIVASFYTYVGIIGQHFLWADIGTFFLGVLAAYWFSARFLSTGRYSSRLAIQIGWVGLLLLIASFLFFTSHPPQIGLFQNPQE